MLLVLLFFSAASSLLLWALIPQLRHLYLDKPNFRSSHLKPTPTGGGVVFVLFASASSVITFLNNHRLDAALLPVVAVPLAVVGMLDDRFNLPSVWRFSVQLITAALILCLSPLVQSLGLSIVSGSLLLLPVVALLLIGVTAVINFTNFMDGLDGLVAGCMAVAIAALAIALSAPWPLWALFGSLLGFLLLNWSPAKVFMGDVGSTFLGAVFAGLLLQASSWPQALVLLLVATPLLADACLCVLRRVLAGQNAFQAHRLHLFQRLHQNGWSHARVSLTYIVATSVLAVAMLVGGLPWVIGLSFLELSLGVWLDQFIAAPFAVASRPGDR